MRRLSQDDRERVMKALIALPAGDLRQLRGRPGYRRLRVGELRAILRWDAPSRTITVERVSPRGSAYS